jgi:hypothetical protein
MHSQFARAALEDQPAVAGVGAGELKDVTEEGSGRVRVVGVRPACALQ